MLLLAKFHSSTSYCAVGQESIIMNQQHMLNKVIINKTQHIKQGYILTG